MKRTIPGPIRLAALSAIALGGAVTPAIGEPQRPGAVVGRVADGEISPVAGAPD